MDMIAAPPVPKAAARPASPTSSAHPGLLRRKCACGGTPGPSGECEECRKKRLNVQRRAAHETESAIVDRALYAMSDSTSRPAYNFATVPVHARSPLSIQTKLAISQPGDQDEEEADRAAEQLMRAATRAASDRNEPPRLSAAEPRVQRQAMDEAPAPAETTQPPAPATPEITPEPATPSETLTATLLVDDEATELSPGQMRKSEFLDALRTAVCAAADAELAAVGRSTEGCPYIEYWIGYYRTRDSQHIERAIRRYAPEMAGVTTARDYIPLITERVRRGVVTWAMTGQITGVPEELAGQVPEMGGAPAGAASAASSVVSGIGGLLFKARDGGAREADPPEIQSQLRSGSPLDSGVKARMESAFGHDFSRARVHTNGQAANLSSSLNARAFTIGSDIAFGAGEYQPGTLIGDALIAHELAHVVQQGSADSSSAVMQKGESDYNSLEEDADNSAVGALVSLWNGTKSGLTNIAQNTLPHLKSGLRLQCCRGRRPAPPVVKSVEVENSAASDTYEVPSKLGAGGKKHWVTVANPAGTKPIVKAVLDPAVPATDPRAAALTWTINGAATPFSGDALHLETPRDATKKVVQATLGASNKELTVWPVEVTIASPAVALNPAPTGAAPYFRQATKSFTGTVKPPEMITDADYPDLSGPKTVALAGTNYCGVALNGGADHKWDISRQLEQTVLNPNGIPAPAAPPAGPACFWAAVAFPGDDTSGNDDTTATDETNDPYSNAGVITSSDTPGQPIPDALGANGNTLEWQLNFREFARLEYNVKWWRVSGPFAWNVRFRARKTGGRWVDNGSSAAP